MRRVPEPIVVIEAFDLGPRLLKEFKNSRVEEGAKKRRKCVSLSVWDEGEVGYQKLEVPVGWLEGWKPFVEAREKYYEDFPWGLPYRAWQYAWALAVIQFGPSGVRRLFGLEAEAIEGVVLLGGTTYWMMETDSSSYPVLFVGAWSEFIAREARKGGLPMGEEAEKWMKWLAPTEQDTDKMFPEWLAESQLDDEAGALVLRPVARKWKIDSFMKLSRLTLLLDGWDTDYVIPVPGNFEMRAFRDRFVWVGTRKLSRKKKVWKKMVAREEARIRRVMEMGL